MIAPSAYPKQFGHSPVHQWSPLYMPRPSIDTHLLSSGDPYGQDDMPGLTRSTSYSPDSDSLVTPPSSMLGLPHQLFDHPQSYGRSSGMSDASTPRLFSPEPLLAADSGEHLDRYSLTYSADQRQVTMNMIGPLESLQELHICEQTVYQSRWLK